jgi:ketosteroid isomerase-like protein
MAILRSSSLEADLIALEMSRRDAITRGDVAAVASFLADEFHYAHINGMVEDRAAFLQRTTEQPNLITFTTATELNVSVRSGYALMTGKSHIETPELTVDTLFLAVWEPGRDDWKLAAYASTPLPNAVNEPRD